MKLASHCYLQWSAELLIPLNSNPSIIIPNFDARKIVPFARLLEPFSYQFSIVSMGAETPLAPPCQMKPGHLLNINSLRRVLKC